LAGWEQRVIRSVRICIMKCGITVLDKIRIISTLINEMDVIQYQQFEI